MIRKKAFQRPTLQEGKLWPFLCQSCSRAGERWFSASGAEPLQVIADCLDAPSRHSHHESTERFHPVHARSRRKVQLAPRRKPLSLPFADCPVEIEQLVSVVRGRRNSADLGKCLDALSISIKPFHVAKALRHIDEAESALRFFGWAAKQPNYSHNLQTCTALVTILAKAREFDRIWELLSEMQASGLSLGDVCFNATIKAYGEMGNGKEAIRTLHRMEEFGVSPTAYSYNTVLSGLLKSQQLDLAMEIYHEMQQLPHIKQNTFSQSMMISALCDAGRLQEAEKVAMGCTTKGGVSINKVAWTTLINGFCKAGNVKKGIELLLTMKDMGLGPNVITYSAVIAGFCKLGKLSDAMAYLDIMRADGFEPNAITYTPLLDAFCKAGQINKSHVLLKKFFADGGKGNTVLYCILVAAYSKSGRMVEACALYNEMVKDGCFPNASTYATLIQGLCEAGMLDEALKVLNQMRERKCELNAAVYNVMIKALSKAGCKDEAGKMFQAMVAQGYEGTGGSCKELMKCLCQPGSLDTAKQVLSIMLKMNHGMNASIFNVFLKGFCDANQVDSAYQHFKYMLEDGFTPDSKIYNILIHGASKAGDLKMVSNLYSEMQSKGFDPNIYTYASLCQAAWKAKRADGLLEIYDDMREQHVRANPFVFSILMKALCSMDKVPEACDLCSQIFRDGFEFSNCDEQGSFLDQRSFLKVQIFVPLLTHLQDSSNVGRMASMWDSVLEKGIFSWYEQTNNDLTATVEGVNHNVL